MAGLTRNTNLRSRRRTSLPIFPIQDTSLGPYYSMDSSESAYINLPGFAGGTAGRSIRILLNAVTSFSATLYNVDGTTSSDGVWNGGITFAEIAGNAAADRFVGCYMDEADQMWYVLTVDTTTSPDTLYFSKVNEAGAVTTIGNSQLGNASMNGMWYNNAYIGNLYRKGGDGSGDFAINWTNTAGGNSAAGVPNRGVEITISASDASLSYANILPSTSGVWTAFYNAGKLGPTANNIVGGSSYSHSSANRPGLGGYGSIVNTSTGKYSSYALFGAPESNGYPWGSGTFVSLRHRKKYVFATYGSTQYGACVFDEDEVHAWLDELAVFYGIL